MIKKSVLLFSSYLLLVSCAANNNYPVHQESYTPGLGEIMSLTSMRHAKLGLAGLAKNWQLAEYELDELHEGFDDAVKFHPTHKHIKDVAQLIAKTMDKPMQELETAIKAKNVQQFNDHFDQLTAACNACHQMTEFGFNVVTHPVSNPFVNQDFTVPR
jgi:hypothetical protein